MGKFLVEIKVRKRKLHGLKKNLRGLQSDESETKAELKWFEDFDKGAAEIRAENLTQDLDSLAPSLQLAKTERARIARKLYVESQRKTSPIRFWKYFTDEQRLLREQIRRLEQKKKLESSVVDKLESNIDAKSKARENLFQQLQKFSTFNCEERKAKLNQLPVDIARVQSEILSTEQEIVKLEQAISPQLAKLEKICTEIKRAEQDILEAKRLDRELSDADDSYERAMTHEECEKKFGNGKPRIVIRERSAKLPGLNKKRKKIENRIEGILTNLTRQITNLIIDGNNVCYERQNFIGLVAIRAMLEELRTRYELTVVFDASIRAMLKTNDRGISDALGNSVRTYVAPTKTKADEYILELANQREDTYIFSNDRYSEYSDYEAVKSERLIRFMVAQGRIVSHEINLSAEFQ